MIYALDTNAIIHLLGHNPTVRSQRDAALERGAQFIIPPYVNFELLRGFHYVQATAKERSYRNLCTWYPIGEMRLETWELAANVYTNLRKSHYTVGDADILIAAFCLIDGYTLITNNTKDFINIHGLQLVDWTIPQNPNLT